LLGRGQAPVSEAVSIDQFHAFFTEKAAAVRAAPAGGLPPTFSAALPSSRLTVFRRITVNDVISAIRRLPDKSCAADAFSANHLKLVTDLIAPFLTELFNLSLSAAAMPKVLTSAVITPLLKKADQDAGDPRSYRPTSNLLIVSKLPERIVFRQLYDCLSSSDFLPRLLSAYRAHRSTETAVLKILTVICMPWAMTIYPSWRCSTCPQLSISLTTKSCWIDFVDLSVSESQFMAGSVISD
jgi:hypothetical protein